ncbi:MAG: BatD family protein, partial [Phycisphaerae bacterium]
MRTGRAIGSFVVAAGWLLPGPRPAAAAQMRAGINPDTIYLGTRTLLEVEVLNPTSNDWPEVATVEGLVIKRYGGPNTIHDLFSGNVRRSFQFLIDPQRAGDFVIPSVTLGRGGDALTDGPFTLHVKEAPLKFVSAEIDREELRPGEQAVVTVAYQGHRPEKRLALPEVEGLVLRDLGPPRIEMTRPEGVPLTIFRIEVTAVRNGTYTLQGISLEGVAAGPVALKVSPFVIVGAQVGDSSLVVGGQTLVHVLARGLERTADVRLVAPAGLKIEPARRQYQYPGSPDTTVFSFEVTATEPGSPVIRSLQMPDGSLADLPKPVALSVRQAGAGDILAARGAVRVQQSVVGEPVIVDYEVFFRGEFRAAAIDLSQTAFANRPYIKVEPVNDLAYPDWTGRPIQVGFGPQAQATALSGAGEINGQKEQLLRFALRITPMAAGELELKGLRVIVQIMVNEQRTIGGGAFQGLSVYRGTREFVRTIDVPPHRVVDPPGKRQPPGYFGAVGRAFSFLTALDRTTASAMSPLTLTLKITGESVGPHFKPPPLTSIPELTRGFEVSPNVGGGEVQGDTITFTQVVRPRSEAVTE